MNFKVALLQMKSQKGKIKENSEIIINMMKEASNMKSDILLLPEAFLTGYYLPITNNEAIEEDNIYINNIKEVAKQYHIGVVLTSFTKGKEKPQNSAYVIDKDGEILMKYSKVHTCDFADEACLESGKDFYVCDFCGIKLGVMICYDREYPESCRILMLKGAEVVLVPNDCGFMKPRVNALSTRAYENMVAVVMANVIGKDCGNSCAFSPICWNDDGCVDNTLLLVDENSEGLFYVDIDMDEIRKYREEEMMGNTYRKVDSYSKLLDKTISYPFIRDNQ